MEPQRSLKTETAANSAYSREAAREAHQWLLRFNPLLDNTDTLHSDECRERLKVIPSLRDSGDRVAGRLREHGTSEDAPLLQTLQVALRELDPLEDTLRKQLARLAPDDPQASVDLDRMQARLAEVAARREVAEVVGPSARSAEGLSMQTSTANWAGALFMGLFSFGWLSFTTFHAFMMIGGMSRTFGGAALGLLGFYAIFFAVGIGMAWGAVMSASQEHLTVVGDQLVLTRSLLGLTWRKCHQLGKDSRAEVNMTVSRAGDSNTPAINYYVYVLSAEGREIKLGAGRPQGELKRLAEQLNDYFQTRRS